MMIRLKIRKVDPNNDNTPILTNQAIDAYAYDVLKEYKPKLLQEPGRFSFQHFLESYLELTLLFRDIYYEEDQNPILGRTIFHNSFVRVFDRENMRVLDEEVSANTVIIDNSVMKRGPEGKAHFTGVHEGGHFLIHPGVYSVQRTGQICCRRENLENFRGLPQNAEQWREHQANRFTSSFTMNDATFIPFAHQCLRKYAIFKRCIILGENDEWDTVAKDLMPEEIADTYGISKTTAYIKLFKSGFVSYGLDI